MKWNWDEFYRKASEWAIVNVPKIIAAIIILLVGFWIVRLLIKSLRKIFEKKNFNPSLRYFLLNLVAITLQIMIIVVSLQTVGIELTFFTAIIAGLTVAAGLALSGTLQNFVSGILILVLHPYRVGDNVIIQGQEGKVSSIQLFYTVVITFDNKTIIVPNGQLSNNVVINLSREGKRRIDVEMKFAYKTDIDAVRKILHELIPKIPGVQQEPALRIGVSNLEADKYTLSIQTWASAHGFEDTRLLVREKILQALKQEQLIA